MQLDAEIIGQMPGLDEEHKKMLYEGEVADGFLKSRPWAMLMEWLEGRANLQLSALRKARFASGDIRLQLENRWHDTEDILKDLQVYFKGLIADRDAVIADYASIVQDMPVQDMPDVAQRDFTRPRVENS